MERDALSPFEHKTLESHIPENFRQQFIEHGGRITRLKLALATYLAGDGVFGKQWLMAKERLVYNLVNIQSQFARLDGVGLFSGGFIGSG